MKRFLLFAMLFTMTCMSMQAQTRKMMLPIPSDRPSKAQLKQIERKYGMFIHFGINTFVDEEWTDGSKPASVYAPASIDADQWVRTAKEAGMKYIILITKHHDGFCLWDSQYTEYDVASSGNPTNVVEEVAKACKKHDIELGLYYSLWDRKVNGDVKNTEQDAAYNEYMLKQLDELFQITHKYTHIVEFWFDGGWLKQNYRWPLLDIYQLIKSKEPECQVGVNWTIGWPDNVDRDPTALPKDYKEGFPIRYFPSDFRLGDPRLPEDNDPKLYTYSGKKYYMPWESTVCISKCWFYNSTDKEFKTVDELEKLYRQCTKNDNILILNCPPDTKGRLRSEDIKLLKELRKRIETN